MLHLLFIILAASCAAALPTSSGGVDFVDPTANGGSWLDDAGGGLGEPMNVRSKGSGVDTMVQRIII